MVLISTWSRAIRDIGLDCRSLKAFARAAATLGEYLTVSMSLIFLNRLIRCPSRSISKVTTQPQQPIQRTTRSLKTTASNLATYNQVRQGCRKEQQARKKTSPALTNRPEMKGVCLRVGIMKPKKPNSGERKFCRVRLSSGKEVSAYISGEGHNVQQHSVVLLRGGRAQDCPGVRYRCVRGAADLVSPAFLKSSQLRSSRS